MAWRVREKNRLSLALSAAAGLAGAAAHWRKERHLVALVQGSRERRKLAVPRHHNARGHLAKARKTGGVAFENGSQIGPFREFGILRREAGDILQNTEKQDSCAHRKAVMVQDIRRS